MGTSGKCWIAILFGLIHSSCAPDPLDQAEGLIAAYNYAQALEVLDSAQLDTTDAHAAGLKATALFMEERTTEGFAELARFRRLQNEGNPKAAKLLLRTATLISREKSRAGEVTTLLDSAISLDLSVQPPSIELAWQRGIEYLHAAGDAGWRYIKFGAGYDQELLTRLRAQDLIISRRFEEIETMKKELPRYTNYGRQFFAAFGKFPANIAELQLAYPGSALFGRTGWEISFGGKEGKIVAQAQAVLINPYGIKRGTILVDE